MLAADMSERTRTQEFFWRTESSSSAYFCDEDGQNEKKIAHVGSHCSQLTRGHCHAPWYFLLAHAPGIVAYSLYLRLC